MQSLLHCSADVAIYLWITFGKFIFIENHLVTVSWSCLFIRAPCVILLSNGSYGYDGDMDKVLIFDAECPNNVVSVSTSGFNSTISHSHGLSSS